MTVRLDLFTLIWVSTFSSAFAQVGSGGAPVPSNAPAFGYTTATDTAQAGAWLGLLEPSGRLGKRDGEYAGLRVKLAVAYGVLDTFTFGGAVTGQQLQIDGVDGLADRMSFVFEGFALNAKYRVQDRKKNGMGLAVEFTPQWTPANPISGAYGEHSFISEFKALADFSIIENVAAAAINVKYYPTLTHLSDGWSETSGTEVSGAITIAVSNGSVGMEVRLLSLYDSLLFGRQTDRAVYVGPTFAVALSDTASLSGSWGTQVDGRSQSTPDRTLDLSAFERHQMILRLNVGF